jgi:hypothetical protein
MNYLCRIDEVPHGAVSASHGCYKSEYEAEIIVSAMSSTSEISCGTEGITLK